jgi:hypothetical protein
MKSYVAIAIIITLMGCKPTNVTDINRCLSNEIEENLYKTNHLAEKWITENLYKRRIISLSNNVYGFIDATGANHNHCILLGQGAYSTNDYELVVTFTDGTELREQLPTNKTVNLPWMMK